MSDDVVGIILAGGRSTRLAPLAVGPGGKAAVECGGVPLLTRVCDAVGQVVPRVIVVAAAGQLRDVGGDVHFGSLGGAPEVSRSAACGTGGYRACVWFQ